MEESLLIASDVSRIQHILAGFGVPVDNTQLLSIGLLIFSISPMAEAIKKVWEHKKKCPLTSGEKNRILLFLSSIISAVILFVIYNQEFNLSIVYPYVRGVFVYAGLASYLYKGIDAPLIRNINLRNLYGFIESKTEKIIEQSQPKEIA
jgi:hypothetical protein